MVALQVLYEVDGSGHDACGAFEKRLANKLWSDETEAYARELIEGVLENRERIDLVISTFAPAWPISQMAVVDRNILRVGIFELTISEGTPPKVAINEAVELGKVFGSDNSQRFVNGVLGSVISDAQVGRESLITEV